MDEENKIKIILKTLEVIKKQKVGQQGQYFDNIFEICSKEHGWDREDTLAAINAAKNGNVITEVPNNGKISYRKADRKAIIIQDATNLKDSKVTEATTDSDALDTLVTDFQEFKRFVASEICTIKEVEKTRKEPKKPNEGEGHYAKALIRSLEERILSLKRQLEQKQIIIVKLLENQRPSQGNPKTLTTSDHGNNKCPMRITEKTNEQESEPKERKGESAKEKKVLSDREVNALEKEKSRATNRNESGDKESTRKKITIIGDSILNGISKFGLKRKHNVKVRAHPGASMQDIKDHIRPVICGKPDSVIIHAGTNDLTKNVDTQEMIREIVEEAKKESPSTRIVLSSLTIRKDVKNNPGIEKKLHKLNLKMKNLAKELSIGWMDNSNIDASCLGFSMLHLNKKGNALLAKNFINEIESD